MNLQKTKTTCKSNKGFLGNCSFETEKDGNVDIWGGRRVISDGFGLVRRAFNVQIQPSKHIYQRSCDENNDPLSDFPDSLMIQQRATHTEDRQHTSGFIGLREHWVAFNQQNPTPCKLHHISAARRRHTMGPHCVNFATNCSAAVRPTYEQSQL